MIWITKLGDRIRVLRIGIPENDELSHEVKGINLNSTDRDIFGKRILDTFKLSDFIGFEGSISFSPFQEEEL